MPQGIYHRTKVLEVKTNNNQKRLENLLEHLFFTPSLSACEHWVFYNILEVQNPLYTLEITVYATAAPGDSKGLLVFWM